MAIGPVSADVILHWPEIGPMDVADILLAGKCDTMFDVRSVFNLFNLFYAEQICTSFAVGVNIEWSKVQNLDKDTAEWSQAESIGGVNAERSEA